MPPSPITEHSTLVHCHTLLSSEIDGELIMLDLEAGQYYGMDGVGARIWQLLAQPCRVSEICRQLEEEYAVAPDTCLQEVLLFARELHDANLIRIV